MLTIDDLEDVTIIQVRQMTIGYDKWFDSEYILKVGSIKLIGRLCGMYEKEESSLVFKINRRDSMTLICAEKHTTHMYTHILQKVVYMKQLIMNLQYHHEMV